MRVAAYSIEIGKSSQNTVVVGTLLLSPCTQAAFAKAVVTIRRRRNSRTREIRLSSIIIVIVIISITVINIIVVMIACAARVRYDARGVVRGEDARRKKKKKNAKIRVNNIFIQKGDPSVFDGTAVARSSISCVYIANDRAPAVEGVAATMTF